MLEMTAPLARWAHQSLARKALIARRPQCRCTLVSGMACSHDHIEFSPQSQMREQHSGQGYDQKDAMEATHGVPFMVQAVVCSISRGVTGSAP